jgi:hypothetical protein
MANTSPPPLPGHESAWVTYIRFALVVIPSGMVLLFAKVFVFPKVLVLWNDAGLTGSRVQWLIDSTSFLLVGFATVLSVSGLMFLFLELREGGWKQFRPWVVLFVAAILNLAVLSSITMMSISACLAAPLVAYKEKQKTPP